MTRFSRIRSGSKHAGRLLVKGTKMTARGTYKGWQGLRWVVSLPGKIVSVTLLAAKYGIIFFLGLLAISLFVAVFL